MRTSPSKSDLQATTERLAAYKPGEKLTLVLPVSGVRYNCTVTVPHTGATLRACIKVTEVRTNARSTWGAGGLIVLRVPCRHAHIV
jgi:hypothetical protein